MMEGEVNRRSGSFGSQATAEASNEEAKRLSLSEGSIVDKEISPQLPESQESSPAGTLKKPRKFKPRKYIAKKLKLRKSDKGSDDQEQNTAESQSEQDSIKTSSSVSSKLSEKLSSPKLQRFNFVKRFSSGKKSYRVSPLSDDPGEESKSSVRSLSLSESSFHEETETQSFVSEVEIPLEIPPSKEKVVTLESKKVELKITMAKFEKRETSPSALEQTTVDKASVKTSQDIELPRATREAFFARPPYMEQQQNPINDAETFAAVVREGLSVKSPPPADHSSEVEKYSILTSSLNTILTTAKDLEDFGANRGGELKFPDLPELRILEEKDKIEEKVNNPEKAFEETSQEDEDNSIEKEVRKNVSSFNTSTPIRPEAEQEPTELEESNIQESDDMRKQKKSKIPIDQKRLSASFDASTSTSTVHTQEAKSPYHVNLPSPSSVELAPSEIKFEVGTPVRNFPSPTGSTTILAPLAKPEGAEDSIDESFHSPKSETSLQPESITRRKIAYVPQLTIYSPEEQELLKSNFEANADSMEMSSTMADSSVFPVFDDSLVRIFNGFFLSLITRNMSRGQLRGKARH